MSSDVAIAVRNLCKEYDLGLSGRTRSLASIARARLRHPWRGDGYRRERFRALDDVSFDVSTGEVVGVIGRNGAGKSTLLKILSRITPPTDGHVDMYGSVGSLLEVGTGFHPELTGLENIYLNGSILGMSKPDIERRLEEIIEFADVRRFLETPVKRYSSGMRVRLAFAVAAHLDPEVLIVDEVLSVGDTSFQAKCLDKMRAIAATEGRTVLYVSHNLVTVEHLCQRTMLLVDGRLDFDGPTGETIDRYLGASPEMGGENATGVYDLSTAGSEHRRERIFRSVTLRPGGGAPSTRVQAAGRLHLSIGVHGLENCPEATIVVNVGSSAVRNLFQMNSRMRPIPQAHATRRTSESIELTIPSLPLSPGRYHVGLAAWSPDGKELDRVEQAADFEVVVADVHGTGYRVSANDGQFIVPWEWELRPSEDDRLAG